MHVPVTTVSGRAYPFPGLRTSSTSLPSSIAEEAERSPAVRAAYEAYLWQWREIFRALGDSLAEAGRIPEAVAVFEYLVASSRDAASPVERARLLGLLYGLGELYKMAGDHRATVRLYDTIMVRGLAPDDPRPAHYAGWSSYELKEYEAALRYYDEALRIDAAYGKVYFNRALALRNLGHERGYRENLDKAVELTRAAYEREGDTNPRIPFSLAIFAATEGKPDEALKLLERTLEADRLYVVRAEHEAGFRTLRDRANEPYFSRFRALLDRYRPARTRLGEPSASYDRSIFNE